MVLHNNKWDRKSARAYHRKHQSKDDQGATSSAKGGTLNSSRKNTDVEAVEESDSNDPGDASDLGETEGQQTEGGTGTSRNFSRRKLQTNAWRYAEPEDDEGENEVGEDVEKEPQPDYVRMTVGKEQFVAPADEVLDTADTFSNQTIKSTKGKIIKVDQRDFQDIHEKIAKQSSADAFRRKFGARKLTSTGSKNQDYSVAVDEVESDTAEIDQFLGELKLRDKDQGARPATSQSARNSVKQLSFGKSDKRHNDDDEQWLDAMLQSRR